MRDYKNYLFDADGTLIDTTELICKCFENTARLTGNIHVEKDEIIRHMGLTLRDQMTIYFGDLQDSQFEEYKRIHMEYQMSIYSKYLQVFDGVVDVLAELKKKEKKCAVVTSRLKDSLSIYLKDTGILQYFDVLITPESTSFHKPHPAPALKALESLSAIPEESLFVGDATFDIECGSNAGIDTAFVLWSTNDPATLKVKPTYYLNEISELILDYNSEARIDNSEVRMKEIL
jgi:HAD superfamily hydrolase (TIGR01549 family)